MAIRKDGIEFDTVEELLQYIGNTKAASVVKPIVVVTTKPKTKSVSTVSGTRWSNDEVAILKDGYRRYKKRGRINMSSRGITILSKQLKRTKSAVIGKAFDLGLTPGNKR